MLGENRARSVLSNSAAELFDASAARAEMTVLLRPAAMSMYGLSSADNTNAKIACALQSSVTLIDVSLDERAAAEAALEAHSLVKSAREQIATTPRTAFASLAVGTMGIDPEVAAEVARHSLRLSRRPLARVKAAILDLSSLAALSPSDAPSLPRPIEEIPPPSVHVRAWVSASCQRARAIASARAAMDVALRDLWQKKVAR